MGGGDLSVGLAMITHTYSQCGVAIPVHDPTSHLVLSLIEKSSSPSRYRPIGMSNKTPIEFAAHVALYGMFVLPKEGR
jgi:hypothetical protein